MNSVVVRAASVGARCTVVGALLGASACGEDNPGDAREQAGTGGTQVGGSSGSSSASGSGGVESGGRSAGAGATAGSDGRGGAGQAGAAAGSGPALAGAAGTAAGSGGAGSSTGGSGGVPSAGAGGSSGGAGGAPPSAGNSGNSGDGNDAGAGAGSEALSFESDIWPMFAMLRDPLFVYPGAGSYESCVATGVCHGGQAPGARLSMPDAATAYGMLLDVESRTELCDGTLRVVPGDPAASCLVLFYEGRLRDELGWVDTAEIDRVRAWIADGALP